MRAIWKGAVSFGLVSVPVKLYSATESHDISFRQVHAKDGGRIKYQRVCSVDGEEVAYADIAKGYETDDGEMVILDDEDLAQLPANSSREISVEKFVPRDQIDPMMLEKSYYLEPEKSGLKPYALLRDALKESDRVAVVTVSLRTRMTPAVLRVRDDVLVMQTMMWPDEIRSPDFGSLRDVDDAKPQELKMAQLLLDTLAGDYDPNEFEDDYAAAVHELVEAKLAGGEVKRTKEPAPSAGEVVDLLAALQKSVAAAKSARGEDPGQAEPAAVAATEASADEAAAEVEPAEEKPKKSASKKGDAKKKPAAKKSESRKKPAAKKTTEKKPAKKSA
jgi:DNA end-binding protein Ku